MLNAIQSNRSGAVPSSAARVFSARWALAGLSLTMLLSSLGTSIANIALPSLAVAFGASFQAIQWVVLAYLLAITTLIVGVGRLGDIVGRRKLLIGGIVLFTVASAVSAAAGALWQLIAARAAQGLGAAAMMALAMTFVRDTVPKERTGRAMGLLATMSAVGTALGPSLGGVLIGAAGWQAIFLVNVPLGVAALALVYRHLPADRAASRESRVRFDGAGTVVLALTLAAYALAMTMGRGSFGWINAGLLLIAALGLAGFVRIERRVASPLIGIAIFRDGKLSASLAASAMVSTVMMATLVVGPFYLAIALGFDAAIVGLVVSVGPVVVALAGIPAGRLADRFGAHRMSMAGLGGIAIGAALLALLPSSSGVAGYVLPLVVVTGGYALFQTANNTAVMADLAADRRGVISGLLNLSRNLGLVTGASVLGAVFAVAIGADIVSAPPADVAAGMRITFAAAALVALGALAAVFAGQVRHARAEAR